jgi:hypothetical protein
MKVDRVDLFDVSLHVEHAASAAQIPQTHGAAEVAGGDDEGREGGGREDGDE